MIGFLFNRKRDYKNHIRELGLKGRISANRVWGLGERIYRDDFLRRSMLFNYLVRSVMAYGVKIWRWEERRELEKIMLDYVRWVFRLDFCTPKYIILRELGIEKLRVGCGVRARKFEKKMREIEDSR